MINVRHVARAVLAATILSLFFFAPRRAFAADKDQAALAAATDKALSGEVGADVGKKIKALVDKCKSCSGSELGKAYLVIGLSAEKAGDSAAATTAWNTALTYDSNVTSTSEAFQNARKAWITIVPEQDDARRAGWVIKGAYAQYKEALAATLTEKWSVCVEKDTASIATEDSAAARSHLAFCEEKLGKLMDALRDNAKALERAKQVGDQGVVKTIQDRVTLLLPRLGHLRIERPVEVLDLKVFIDDHLIPDARLVETFTVDPGPHRMHAEGMLRSARVTTDDTITLAEGEIKTAKITMKPMALTPGQLECMANAKTQEDILICLPQQQKALIAHASLEMNGYVDSLDTHVLSPAVRGAVSSPTQGWNVGASYLVDIVTAASPDVVASASRRFQDVRHDVAVTGGYKPGDFGAQLNANYSTEHDYESRTIGITGIGDFRDKSITPTLGYSFTWNTIGRTGTDFDEFHHTMDAHDINLASTFVLNPTSLFVVGADVAFEVGDQSKPYRYIPLFEPGVSVPAGASINEVNALRLPTKPLEQLPLHRNRFALTGRYIIRLNGNSTLRLEERLYRDSWKIMASTTDARYLTDMGRFRFGPHVHLHMQTPASFYRRIYPGILDADGFAMLPEYRTTDRELSPMWGVTGGGQFRFALTPSENKIQLGLFASGDVLYNRYLDSLYTKSRIAGYGTVGIEGDFE